MYLAMTQQEYEDVLNEAPFIVGTKLGLQVNQDRKVVEELIREKDSLASGLLDRYLEVYTEWWEASCLLTQGDPGSKEKLEDVRRLMVRRSLMRSSLMNYLGSEYPTALPT